MAKKKIDPDEDYTIKETKAGLFEILKNICESKENRWYEFKKGYSPFIINRFLSMLPDTIGFAEWVNKSTLNPREQYEFYLAVIPKRRRYFKYIKATEETAQEEEIQELIKYNRFKAREAAKVIKSAGQDI